jgi:hypothetical protein
MIDYYWCDIHGQQLECDIDETGERVCQECGEWVEAITA